MVRDRPGAPAEEQSACSIGVGAEGGDVQASGLGSTERGLVRVLAWRF